MNWLAASIICVASLAQPAVTLPGQAGPQAGGAPAEQPPLIVTLFAIRAADEGRSKASVSDELKEIEDYLEGLEGADTFELISNESRPAPFGTAVSLPINGLYSGLVQLNGMVPDPEGGQERVDLQARIDLMEGNEFTVALNTRALAAFQQGIVFRGLELGQDEMIAVLMVSQPPSDQQQQDQSGEEGDESEGEQDQEQDSKHDDESDEQDESEENPEDESGEGEAEQSPPDLDQEDDEGGEDGDEEQDQQSPQSESDPEGEPEPQNLEQIEAILESLEEIDRKEQRNAHYRRSQVKIRGDWW